MIDNSINECRFQDTSYYYWLLANQYLAIDLPQSQTYDQLANIYFTYNIVHKYCQEPFTSYKPDVLFNVSRYDYYNRNCNIYSHPEREERQGSRKPAIPRSN